MCAEGAKAISRWLSEAIPPVAEETVLAPRRGATMSPDAPAVSLRSTAGQLLAPLRGAKTTERPLWLNSIS